MFSGIYDFNFMNLRDKTKVQAWLQSPAYFDEKGHRPTDGAHLVDVGYGRLIELCNDATAPSPDGAASTSAAVTT